MAPSSRLDSRNKGSVCVVSWAQAAGAEKCRPRALVRKKQGVRETEGKSHFWALPVPIRRGYFFLGGVTNVQISGHWILRDPNTQIQKAALA